MKLLIPVTNKHAPIKKMIVKIVKSLWIDEEFKKCMVERDEAKGMENKSGCTTDWQPH
jgi:mannitol/fructose-specific phosphotransferase system IIA component